MTDALQPSAPLSPADLRAHVHEYLNTPDLVPEGKSGVLVTVVNLDHVAVVAAIRVREGWTVNIIGQQGWDGDRKLEASISHSW